MGRLWILLKLHNPFLIHRLRTNQSKNISSSYNNRDVDNKTVYVLRDRADYVELRH